MPENPYQPPKEVNERTQRFRFMPAALSVLGLMLTGMAIGSVVAFVGFGFAVMLVPTDWIDGDAIDVSIAGAGFGAVGGWTIGLVTTAVRLLRRRHAVRNP